MSGQCDYCSSNPCACWIDDIDSDISTEKQRADILLDKLDMSCKERNLLHEREQKLKEALESIAEATVSRRWMMDKSRDVLKELYGGE